MINNRILIKLSGEALSNNKGFGIDYDYLLEICKSLKKLSRKYQIGIVIGGGNFFRGRQNMNMDAVIADNIGMYATIMNAMAIKNAFEVVGIDSIVQVPSNPNSICEVFSKEKAIEYLNSGKIVIFGGGTGNPYFSTDTAASLRALEIEASILIKLTNVDGVYNKDPNKYMDAVMYKELSFKDAIENNIKVMDTSSFAMCNDNDLTILVTNINKIDDLSKIIEKREFCTLIYKK